LCNIVLLKHIEAFPQHVSVRQVTAGPSAATLVLLDTSVSAYDRQSYPEAGFAVLISSDEPALTRHLIKSLPNDRHMVFKLASDADRDVVGDRHPVRRATSFLSFTAGERSAFAADEGVNITNRPSNDALRMFEAQGHTEEWLRPLLTSGRAFACLLEQAGEMGSACIAFENYRQMWEVGGVVTSPQHRRRGLASRVVRTALAELQRRSLIPRYQVNEDNLPSIRLARSVGLHQFLQLTHYRTW
jgi:RimJ/RimL family protein N-acetyltransferase